MITMLRNWPGTVEINGTAYDSVDGAIRAGVTFSDTCSIRLLPKSRTGLTDGGRAGSEPIVESPEYRITVKAYMTKPTEPGSGFDFMEKFNGNKPMPMRTMVGTVDKETRGMLHMKLHGQGLATITCMRCGRNLTHPVSRHYGIGPECMSKLGFVCDIDDVDTIKEKLQDVSWEGWVIKSAIIEKEEVE